MNRLSEDGYRKAWNPSAAGHLAVSSALRYQNEERKKHGDQYDRSPKLIPVHGGHTLKGLHKVYDQHSAGHYRHHRYYRYYAW